MTYIVAVGTESALKIRAVKAAFEGFGQEVIIFSCKAESGVGIQPVGTEEMENGATNRAQWAQQQYPDADLYIGIESGLVQQNWQWFDPACVVVLTCGGGHFVAFGAYFPIPTWMAKQTINEKTELGEVVKKLAGGGEKDPMKYLSAGTIPREQLLAQAIQCALTPFLHAQRY